MTSDASENQSLRRIRRLVGDDNVILAEADLRFFAQDALGDRGMRQEATDPLAVVRPANAEGVAALLSLASELRIPVVAYGAGTGLMGGGRSLARGIVLDTIRLNHIEVSPADRLVRAGAGAILADVDRKLQPHGLMLAHDPWTFPVATVGGTLSTNSLGYKGGRYGGMGDQAIALEVALADGSVMRTRAVSRHSAGPDLKRLFIGAEGSLGVITAAALRGHPIAEARELRSFDFGGFAQGFDAIDAMSALGLRPVLLDYGEEHASPWPDLSSRAEEPPILHLGFEGLREEVEFSLRRAEEIIAANGGNALGSGPALRFWQDRHVVAERFRRGQPRRRNWQPGLAFDYLHVALPPSQVLLFQRDAHQISAQEGVGLLECGLWTGPEFFSCVVALPEANGGHQRLSTVTDILLQRVQDLGGSMEYVHGAGLRLAHLMRREHGAGLDALRRIKLALDPASMLNPGKLGLD